VESGKERQKQMSDIRYQISGKTKTKKQQKQKRKEFSNVFAFYILLHLLTTDNCPLTTVFQQAVVRNIGEDCQAGGV